MRKRRTTTKGRPWNFAREERKSYKQLLSKRTGLCSTSNRTSLRWIYGANNRDSSKSYNRLGIKTFGNEEIDRTEKRNKVQFSVGDIGGFSKSRMEANIVPEICAPIGSQEIDRAKRCCAHLEEIDFADGNHVNEEMKIHFNNWSRSYVVLFHWRDKKRRD